MKQSVMIALVAIVLTGTAVWIHADSRLPQDSALGTRVVLIRGKLSSVLDGDTLKVESRYESNALPLLLKDGWKVKALHPISATGERTGEPAAYVILEK